MINICPKGHVDTYQYESAEEGLLLMCNTCEDAYQIDWQLSTPLGAIADGIGGEVWHSGGGIFGVLFRSVKTYDDGAPYPTDDQNEFFFGFADGTLGWDVTDYDGNLLGFNAEATRLSIDQTEAVISMCLEVLNNSDLTTWLLDD